MGNRKIRSE